MPLLALAIATVFLHQEMLNQAQGYLTTAAGLINPGSGDPEMVFSRALYAALSAEFQVFQLRAQSPPPSNGQLTGAKNQAQAALGTLQAAAAQNGASTLAQTVSAMFGVFTQTGDPTSPSYAKGVADLSKLKDASASPDLAAFCLVYAYRRAEQYAKAIQVGQELEKRQPNSAMVKKAIGGSYFFTGDTVTAEKYYKQALALNGEDPTVLLALANVKAKSGDIKSAKEFAKRVAAADPNGQLKVYLDDLKKRGVSPD
jgi:tetratricopeptide (TPR) repeat protein